MCAGQETVHPNYHAWAIVIAASLGIIASACGPGSPGEGESDELRQGRSTFLRNGDFELTKYDSGDLTSACTVAAPWGSNSWGIEGSTFSDPNDHTLAGARFVENGHQGYLYGREDSGRWGFVRFIQGNLWGGTNCGDVR